MAHLSRASRTSVRVPTRSIRYLWRIRPGAECPPTTPGLLGDSGPCPMAQGVDQLSQAIAAQLRGPAVSTSSPGPLVLGSEGPRGRPAVQGDSGPGPKAGGVNQLSLAPRVLFRGLGVNQLSRMSWAFFRGPTGSTSCPWRLGLSPKALVSTICPWRFALKSVDPRGPTTVPGDRGPVPVPAGSTRCPGQLGPGPRSRSCDQLSRATRVRGRGPVVSTSCPA